MLNFVFKYWLVKKILRRFAVVFYRFHNFCGSLRCAEFVIDLFVIFFFYSLVFYLRHDVVMIFFFIRRRKQGEKYFACFHNLTIIKLNRFFFVDSFVRGALIRTKENFSRNTWLFSLENSYPLRFRLRCFSSFLGPSSTSMQMLRHKSLTIKKATRSLWPGRSVPPHKRSLERIFHSVSRNFDKK